MNTRPFSAIPLAAVTACSGGAAGDEFEVSAFGLLIILVVAIASGLVSQYVAFDPGHTSMVFFWVGLFIPVVGLLVAFLSPVPEKSSKNARVQATLASQIEELSRLHKSGVLSDSEFEAAKRRVIEKD